MNISEKTSEILKNFSGINTSFLTREGNRQSTMSVDKSIFAEAVIPDEFPLSTGIYDLPQFLSNLSLLNDPSLSFEDNNIMMKDKDAFTFRYMACDKENIFYPEADFASKLAIKSPDLEFDLPLATLEKLTKIANTNAFTHIVIFSKNGKFGVKTESMGKANVGTYILDENSSIPDFESKFKTEALKNLLPMNYHIKVKKGVAAQFENSDATLFYLLSQDVPKKTDRKNDQ